MSPLQSLYKEIDSLFQQMESLKPFKKTDEDRLWKKFRLEWNYNSNHIEGNTLTYGQTELLLMFDKTTGDHDMREFEEMKAHDAIVHLVRDYAADKTRELSETDIRQWNKTILVRPFWTNAQTADKQPTRKLVTPGEYKREPNSVLLSNGEMFHYASPEETPGKMQELMAWYRKVSEEGNFHPVEIAALLHYKFVCIHPFDDCNGRTSRLLMNYVLFRNSYPPVIIKSADKKNYLNALNKADVGDINSFVQYIAEQLLWSLEISVKAGKGESIEEDDDVDKELDLLTRGYHSKNVEAPVKSKEVVLRIFETSIKDFFSLYMDSLIKLSKLIAYIKIDIYCKNYQSYVFDEKIHFDSPKVINELTNFVEGFIKNQNSIGTDGQETISFIVEHDGIKNDLSIVFKSRVAIEILFESYFYQVNSDFFSIKRLYSQPLTSDEIRKIVHSLYRNTFDLAKESLDKNSNSRQG
jgi:Fic family protein